MNILKQVSNKMDLYEEVDETAKSPEPNEGIDNNAMENEGDDEGDGDNEAGKIFPYPYVFEDYCIHGRSFGLIYVCSAVSAI